MVAIVEVPPPASADDPNTRAALADAELWNAENQAQLGYALRVGNPPALVAVHMLGTAVFTAAVAHLWLLAPPRSVAAG